MCLLYSFGKTAYVTIGSIALSYLGDGGTKVIFTLPAKYKPKYITKFNISDSDKNAYIGTISADTIIQIDNLPTNNLHLSGQFSYILA